MNKIVVQLNRDLSELEDSLILDPSEIESFIAGWKGNLHDYSLRNYMLARMQNPNVTVLAGYQTWVKEKGLQVMKGQHAIKILAPMRFKPKRNLKKLEDQLDDEGMVTGFRTVNVFDISQVGKVKWITVPTTGSHLAIDPLDKNGIAFGGEEYVNGKARISMADILAKTPVEVKFYTGTGWENGSLGPEGIELRKDRKELLQIATYFHEFAHWKLGHLGADMPREVKEVEADAVAYLVGKYFGIDNQKAAHYIMNWKGDKKMLKGHGKTVIATSEWIINLFEPKEEKNDKQNS